MQQAWTGSRNVDGEKDTQLESDMQHVIATYDAKMAALAAHRASELDIALTSKSRMLEQVRFLLSSVDQWDFVASIHPRIFNSVV